jgi:hypothetical protein
VQKQPLIYWLKWLISVVFVVILYFRVTDLHAIHFDIDHLLAEHWELVLAKFPFGDCQLGFRSLEMADIAPSQHSCAMVRCIEVCAIGSYIGFHHPRTNRRVCRQNDFTSRRQTFTNNCFEYAGRYCPNYSYCPLWYVYFCF